MTYSQSSGVLDLGAAQWTGYAGNGDGKNNPARQNVSNQGPLPRGWYTVSKDPECTMFGADGVCPHCSGSNHHKHGPYVLRLTPDPENEMFGRGGFLIHGDSIDRPGTASLGCIAVPKVARLTINASGVRRIQVVA